MAVSSLPNRPANGLCSFGTMFGGHGGVLQGRMLRMASRSARLALAADSQQSCEASTVRRWKNAFMDS